MFTIRHHRKKDLFLGRKAFRQLPLLFAEKDHAQRFLDEQCAEGSALIKDDWVVCPVTVEVGEPIDA